MGGIIEPERNFQRREETHENSIVGRRGSGRPAARRTAAGRRVPFSRTASTVGVASDASAARSGLGDSDQLLEAPVHRRFRRPWPTLQPELTQRDRWMRESELGKLTQFVRQTLEAAALQPPD